MGVICVLAAVFLWSAVPLMIKQVAPPFDARWVALLRLGLGAGFLAAAQVYRVRRTRPRTPSARPRRWRGREIAWLLIAGAGIAANYGLYSFGITRTTATAGNLIVQDEIILLALWGLLILHESRHVAKLVGMGLCFAGVFLVAWNGESLTGLLRSQYFTGNLVVAAAGFGWSLYGLGQKLLLRTRGSGESVVSIMVAGTVIALVIALPVRPYSSPPTLLQWGYIGALGIVCTGLGYLLLVRAFRLLEASVVAVVTAMLPVFTMIEAHFLLGERLTGMVLGGAALIITGVILMVVRGEPAPAAPEA